jgi:hypothetical protein
MIKRIFQVLCALLVCLLIAGCEEVADENGQARPASARELDQHAVAPETRPSSVPGCQGDADSVINEIREYAGWVQARLREFDRDSADVWDQSTEGGRLVGYSDSLGVRWIDVTLFGETGKSFGHFVIRDRSAVAVEWTDVFYERPFYHETPAERSRRMVAIILCDTTRLSHKASLSSDDLEAIPHPTGAQWQESARDYIRIVDSVSSIRKGIRAPR